MLCVCRIASHRNIPLHFRLRVRALVNILVIGIRKDNLLLAVQQAVTLGYVVDVPGGAPDGTEQPQVGINADVGFHAGVPLVTFFARMHFGVSGLVCILRWCGRGNQRGIDGGADFEQQAFADQQVVDSGQDFVGQLVLLHPVAKAKNGAFARRSAMGIELGKLAGQRYVEESLFHGGV